MDDDEVLLATSDDDEQGQEVAGRAGNGPDVDLQGASGSHPIAGMGYWYWVRMI